MLNCHNQNISSQWCLGISYPHPEHLQMGERGADCRNKVGIANKRSSGFHTDSSGSSGSQSRPVLAMALRSVPRQFLLPRNDRYHSRRRSKTAAEKFIAIMRTVNPHSQPRPINYAEKLLHSCDYMFMFLFGTAASG